MTPFFKDFVIGLACAALVVFPLLAVLHFVGR